MNAAKIAREALTLETECQTLLRQAAIHGEYLSEQRGLFSPTPFLDLAWEVYQQKFVMLLYGDRPCAGLTAAEYNRLRAGWKRRLKKAQKGGRDARATSVKESQRVHEVESHAGGEQGQYRSHPEPR